MERESPDNATGKASLMERKSLEDENENRPRCWNGNEGMVFRVEALQRQNLKGQASITEKGIDYEKRLPNGPRPSRKK